MSICLGSRFAPHQPLVVYLSAAAPRFRAIELSAEPKHLSPYFTYTVPQKKTLRIYQNSYRFQLTMHAPFSSCRLGALNSEERQLSFIKMLTTMQLAAELEIKYLTFHPCSLEPGLPGRYAENCDREADSLVSLLEEARHLGVNLLMKNMPRLPRFHPSTCDGSRLQELLWLFPEPQFGITIDLGHALQAGVKVETLLCLDRIRHFQIHENNRKTDSHLPITVNLAWWHKILKRLNHDFPDNIAILAMNRFSDQLISIQCLQVAPRPNHLTPFTNANLNPPSS